MSRPRSIPRRRVAAADAVMKPADYPDWVLRPPLSSCPEPGTPWPAHMHPWEDFAAWQKALDQWQDEHGVTNQQLDDESRSRAEAHQRLHPEDAGPGVGRGRG